MLAFDDDSSVICYSNGSYKTYGSGKIYEEDLFPTRKSHPPTFLSVDFETHSYYADMGNDTYMDFKERNLSIALEKAIENKKINDQTYVSWAAIGYIEDSYFLLFNDGRFYWNNVPEKLQESLRKAQRQRLSIKRVCLSTFDDRYLLVYGNGDTEFQYCNAGSLTTRIMKKNS